jgi:hypothetical protein
MKLGDITNLFHHLPPHYCIVITSCMKMLQSNTRAVEINCFIQYTTHAWSPNIQMRGEQRNRTEIEGAAKRAVGTMLFH